MRDKVVDADLLEAAYTMHAAEVYRVVRAIVGSAATAEDVTHDAFIKAHHNLHRYDSSLPIRPWLITIAVRIALDRLRRDRLRKLMVLETQAVLAPSKVDSVDLRIDADRALQTLSPRDRAAVVARHYIGMSYREIALMLGTSEGNVGTLLYRAHARLRHVLSQEYRAIGDNSLESEGRDE